jgi:hypothetical protein
MTNYIFTTDIRNSKEFDLKTPIITRFSRMMWKVAELWRSFTNTTYNYLNPFRVFKNRIQKGNLLKNTDIIHNTQNLQNVTRIDNIENIDEIELLDKSLQSIEDGKIIFLPHVVKNKFRDHIVFFAINPSTKELIFYDSKGFTAADYNLKDILEKFNTLISSTTEKYTFVQKTEKEQYDSYNCGIYVIERIKLLSGNANTPFLDLLDNNPLNYEKVLQARESIEPYQSSIKADDLFDESWALEDEYEYTEISKGKVNPSKKPYLLTVADIIPTDF